MREFLLAHKHIPIVIFIVGLLYLYLGHLGSYHLIDPDEGRYHEIAREMLATGNYLTPKLNGVEYFEKPVLQYWATALMMKIFGINEFAGRIFPALCGLGCIAVTGHLARRMYTVRVGLLAAGILATSFLTLIIASINILDMALTLFMILTLYCFYEFQLSPQTRRWLYGFYISMGLGVLTKGLVAIVLPIAIVIVFALLSKRPKLMLQILYLPAIIAGLIVTVPWFYLVCKANPDFFYFFFIHEHFLRYATKIHHRFQPWWFFIPFIFLGMTPWTGFITSLFSKRGILRSPASPKQANDNLYLLCWFFIIFIFYSISDSKLVPYIMPCFIPLAILLAASIKRCEQAGSWLNHSLLLTMLWDLIFIVALIAALILNPSDVAIQSVDAPIYLLSGILIATVIVIPLVWMKLQRHRCTATMIFIMAFLSGLALHQVQGSLHNLQSSYALSQRLKQLDLHNAQIVNYQGYFHGINFYTQQRVALADFTGELEFGSTHAGAHGWFYNNDQLKKLWNSPKRIIIVVKAKNLQACLHVLDIKPSTQYSVDDYIILINK